MSAERKPGPIDRAEADWHERHPEVLAFARVLARAGGFDPVSDLPTEEEQYEHILYYFEKPWKWSLEHRRWVEMGRPDEVDLFDLQDDADGCYVCGASIGSDYFSDRRTDSGPVIGLPDKTWGDIALCLCGRCADEGEAMPDAEAFEFYADGVRWRDRRKERDDRYSEAAAAARFEETLAIYGSRTDRTMVAHPPKGGPR